MKKILFLCCMLMYVVLYACPFADEENGDMYSNRFIYISGINAPDNHCSGLIYQHLSGSATVLGNTLQSAADVFQYTTKHPQNIVPPFTVYVAYNDLQIEGVIAKNTLSDYAITLSIQISQNTTTWTTVTSRTFKNWHHPLFSKTGKAILGRYTVPASAFSPLGGNYYLRLRIVAKKLDEYGEIIGYMDNIPNEGTTYYHQKECTDIWYITQSGTDSKENEYYSVLNPIKWNNWLCNNAPTGYDNIFNPAHSVYLKITSARRPTHE